MQINENFQKLAAGYLFPEIGRRVRVFEQANPAADVILLGIGDVTEPLPPACIEAMQKALEDQSKAETFRGYGPGLGYSWLRKAVAKHDYQDRGCTVDADEVFISDSSKCDCANILDIFGPGNTVAVVDPAYPVYVDTNVMIGNTGAADANGAYEGLVYLPANLANQFVPALPTQKCDLIYLCYPNNPTGSVLTRSELKVWVDYALENDAVILFDAAYEAFITSDDIPRSIYEIPRARECAIEFRSFSKNAGFTGMRCAYTVVPKELQATSSGGETVSLHSLWSRRQSTKFNSISYVVQRGAEAVYTDEGKAQVRRLVDYYMANARRMREGLSAAGIEVYGGEHAPYLWLRTPGGMTSWDFFDELLNHCHVVGTPGSGYGAAGEGYFRLSAFNSHARVNEALQRITDHMKS